VALVAAGGAVAAWAPARGRLPTAVRWLLAAGAALLVAAALAGAAPLAQLIGLGQRYEGLVVLPVYLLAGLCGARLLGPARAPADERLTVRVLAIAAVAVAILAVLETAGLRPLVTNVSRPGSLLGNASDEGAFGVLVAGPLAAAALRRSSAGVVGVVAALAIVLLSTSRGALVGALAAAVVLLVTARTVYARVAVAGATAGLLVLAVLLPVTAPRVTGRTPLSRATVSGRLQVWSETLALVAKNPVLGVGPSGFGNAILAEHTRGYEQRVGPANPVDSPHDWPLQALAAGGPGLLLVALALAGLTVQAGWRKSRAPPGGAPTFDAGLLAGLAGYGAALLFHFTSPGPSSLAALFGGALLATAVQPGAGARYRLARTIWPAAFAVLLTMAAVAEIPLRAAVLAVGEGHLGAAQRDFAAAHDLRPWDVEVDLTAGHAFAVAAAAGAGEPAAADAVRWLTPALARLPGYEPVLEDLASARETLGQFAAATRLLDIALADDRYNPLLLLRLGVLQAEQHEFDAAVRYLLAAAGIDPRSPAPWQDLAIVYLDEGRPAAAAAARLRADQLAG
jgi:hypothetical protein